MYTNRSRNTKFLSKTIGYNKCHVCIFHISKTNKKLIGAHITKGHSVEHIPPF